MVLAMVTRASTYELPPLRPDDGLRGEGLGIPSHLLGCHSSCLKQEWFWRVRSSSWCFSSRATWSVVGFFWLLGASVVPASSGLQFVVATWGEIGFFRLLCGEWVLLSAVFLPRLWTSLQLCSSKFQQSFVEFYKVPQLQFIDRVVVISVASQRQGSQCKLCKTGDSSAVLCEGLEMPVLCVSRQCRKLWTSRSCRY